MSMNTGEKIKGIKLSDKYSFWVILIAIGFNYGSLYTKVSALEKNMDTLRVRVENKCNLPSNKDNFYADRTDDKFLACRNKKK